MIWALLACNPTAPVDSDIAAERIVADAGPDRLVPLGASVKLDGRGSTGRTFRWTLGDGRTADGSNPTVRYDEPGNYTAVLTVEGPDGDRRTDSVRVRVHPDLLPVANSSTLHLYFGDEVVALNRDANQRAFIGPEGVGYDTACANGTVLALTRRGLLCQTDRLTRILTGPSTFDFSTGRGHRMLEFDGSWIRSSTRPQGNQVAAFGRPLPITGPVAIGAPDLRSIALLNGVVWGARFRSPPTGGVLYGPDGTLTLPLQPGPDTDTGSRGVPNLLELHASPDGHSLFVSGTLSNIERGEARDGLPLTFETTVRGFLSRVDIRDGSEIRRVFDNQGRSGAMAMDPFGTTLYVAMPANRSIQVVDPFTLESMGSLLDVGHGVSGMAVSEDGGTLYVNAELSREVRAYDVSDLTVLPPEIGRWPSVDREPLPPDVLRGKQLFHDAGPRMSKHGYIACSTCHPDGADDGQVWDFTDRGEGLRNTTTLLGSAGTGMGPLHWSGNFDEVQDFENDIRHAFQGDGLMDDDDFGATEDTLGPAKAGLSADLDALAAYVSTLDQPLTPLANPAAGAAAEFEAAGCATCHPAPLYTDSAPGVRHDVGTLTPASGQRLGEPLDGLDTPTLLGVSTTGPWLHDGSAATLTEAILAHQLDAGPLDPSLADRLAAYLETL